MSEKWTMRMGSLTRRIIHSIFGSSPNIRSSEALRWAVDLRTIEAREAQAEEELAAMMDLLLQDVPEDPDEFRRAVAGHLHNAVEVLFGHAGQVVHGRFVDGGHAGPCCFERGGGGKTGGGAGRGGPAGGDMKPLVFQVGDVGQDVADCA